MGKWRVLDHEHKFSPHGEVSASADEGGILVHVFCRTIGTTPFTPLPSFGRTPPLGENLCSEPRIKNSPFFRGIKEDKNNYFFISDKTLGTYRHNQPSFVHRLCSATHQSLSPVAFS